MVKNVVLSILFVCSLFFTVYAQELETCILNDQQSDVVLIGSQLAILEDSTNKLSIADICVSKRFVLNKSVPKFAFVKNVRYSYWIKFSLKEAKGNSKRWVFENADNANNGYVRLIL